MKKLNIVLMITAAVGLIACQSPPVQEAKEEYEIRPLRFGYLKTNITQEELDNPENFKKYRYRCRNAETRKNASLVTYFPLWSESRKQENFGIYFQLDGGKAYPFDYLEEVNLNRRGTKLEVRYRSYQIIGDDIVDLAAREFVSIYSKSGKTWLTCRGG